MRNALLLLVALGLLSACPSPEPAKAPPPPPVAEETPAPTPAPDAGPMITLGLQGGSTLGFVARKNDEADVAGTFTALSGSVSLPGHDLSKATGTVSIAWFGGVDTSDPARDQNIIGTFFGALDATAPAGQVGLNSLEDSIGGKRRRDVDDTGLSAGLLLALGDGAEDGQTEVSGAGLTGVDATDDLRAVGDGLLGVESALFAVVRH